MQFKDQRVASVDLRKDGLRDSKCRMANINRRETDPQPKEAGNRNRLPARELGYFHDGKRTRRRSFLLRNQTSANAVFVFGSLANLTEAVG